MAPKFCSLKQYFSFHSLCGTWSPRAAIGTLVGATALPAGWAEGRLVPALAPQRVWAGALLCSWGPRASRPRDVGRSRGPVRRAAHNTAAGLHQSKDVRGQEMASKKEVLLSPALSSDTASHLPYSVREKAVPRLSTHTEAGGGALSAQDVGTRRQAPVAHLSGCPPQHAQVRPWPDRRQLERLLLAALSPHAPPAPGDDHSDRSGPVSLSVASWVGRGTFLQL